MLKAAITGGIGSGKSIICKVFENLGIPVFYADTESKNLVNFDPLVIQKVIEYFGKDIYLADGVNRKLMASIIFNDPLALQTINAIVHPILKQRFQHWLSLHKDKKYTIMEAAILFESKSETEFDKIISVYAPENLRIKRVMNRDKCSADDVKVRLKNQIDDEWKIKHSHYIIINDDNELVLPQIMEIHKKLIL